MLVREVWVQPYIVEAENEEEAKELVTGIAGVEDELEYSHTLDPETWTVEKEEE